MKNKLPKIKNRRKINVKSFEKLARKVKKTFEEENDYLKKKSNENSSSRGFLINY